MALDPKYFFELNMEFGLLSKLRPTEGATCLWDSRWKPAERRQARAGAHSSPHAALPDNFKKDWRPLPRRCCKVLWVENQPRVSAHGIRSHSTGRARRLQAAVAVQETAGSSRGIGQPLAQQGGCRCVPMEDRRDAPCVPGRQWRDGVMLCSPLTHIPVS